MLATDLSAAFDLVDAQIFKKKLEFYGVQKRTINIFENYMTGRTAVVNLQGFTSEPINCEDCGSVQGGKLSGLIFNINNNEAVKLHEIMNKPELFRKLTNEDISISNIDHAAVNFVDDQTNMIAGDDYQDIQAYIRKFMTLIIHYYGANRLKLNDEKTQILLLKSQFRRTISIIASDGSTIWNIAQMKILGIHVNAKNNYRTNIAKARSQAGKPVLLGIFVSEKYFGSYYSDNVYNRVF